MITSLSKDVIKKKLQTNSAMLKWQRSFTGDLNDISVSIILLLSPS